MSDWPSPVEAEMHIRGELSRLGIPFKDSPQWFQIICPFPHDGGLNTKRNFGIQKNGKSTSCFVCGTHGSWQKIAPVLGATKFGSSGLISAEGIDLNLAALVRERFAELALSEADDLPDIPEGLTPWVGSWRGLSETFLRKLQAHHWWHTIEKDGRSFSTERIWFPCNQSGKYNGYFGRRLDNKDVARYYNAPWMHSVEMLYPFDYMRSLGGKRVVLVEGPVDALTLLQGGVPAVAILGTENLGNKHMLLAAAGYEKVYVMFDNDSAGAKAVPDAVKNYSTVMDVEVMSLPAGRDDPGKLTPDEVGWMRSYVYTS